MRSNEEGNQRLSEASESVSTSRTVIESKFRELISRFPDIRFSPGTYNELLRQHADGGLSYADIETIMRRLLEKKYSEATRRQREFYVQMMIMALKRGSTRIVRRPPGALMLRIAEVLCTSKRLEDVYKPIIADYQHEYFEALKSGNRPRILFVKVRHYWGFLKATGLAAWVFGCVAAVLKYLKGAS